MKVDPEISRPQIDKLASKIFVHTGLKEKEFQNCSLYRWNQQDPTQNRLM
jgi:hypothetical protein